MGKTIIIHRCRKCGKEVIRDEYGDPKNPDGSITHSAQFKTVSELNCPFCKKKGEKK
jgi:endogenous inhibitor of DNA gyrase (YacG/DUF329 family)